MTRTTAKYLVPAALAAAFVTLSPDAMAASDDGAMLTQAEARQQARQFMRQQGFTRVGKSLSTARIGTAELINDIWHVEVRYGGTLGSNSGSLLVDALNGNIRLDS